ncbi:Succinyl-CoA ligase [GDP-forming] subunit beta [Echinococcus granulosus]|uniref:Succinyl-CoA synthetase beta chain n=1 Tax=Echinococcus granulosus TaxID=6210 RepID=W6UUY0_ECHGR|nr:Succinyl-CoA ligase [GDP-forming] subunit beta [Echinococcus granulosus]EUB57239.1 Succinyl-CoA ligase [GDP-forming] subunit beta [Echinococcus granulosus]
MSFGATRKLLSNSPKLLQFRRSFNLPEYQSKILMNEYDLAVQDFRIASSVEEAERIVASFKPNLYVLKAQVQAGGRKLGHFATGGGSGIQFTNDPQEVPIIVSKMIGNRLVTKQTTADGVVVNTVCFYPILPPLFQYLHASDFKQVMIADAVNLKKERYLAILLDREACCPVVVTSVEGGVNIEDVARTNPDTINREFIDLQEGMTDKKAGAISCSLGFPPGFTQHKFMCSQLKNLYNLFVDLDCLQVEINPLGEKEDGSLVNMDAKFSFDNNAVYRQPRVAALAAQSRKLDLEAAGEHSLLALETSAEAHGLNYIGLPDGTIGCMVNGAGLAMATLDLLSLHRGRAANFLDLGGKASQADVEFALQTLASDDRVKCILINIFGGIVNCRMVAEGIVAACRRQKPRVPLVVRLEGTNSTEGRDVLRAPGLDIHIAKDMEEAASMACGLTE